MLEFYLTNELKEKESFFFTLYQLKEYRNVEELLDKATMFDAKMLKEIKYKLKELRNVKKNWIEKERFNYEPLSCQIKRWLSLFS